MKSLTKKIILVLLLCYALCTLILLDDSRIFVFAHEQNEIDEHGKLEGGSESYSGYGCNNGVDLQVNLKDQIENNIPEVIDGFGCSSSCGASREGGYSSSYHSGCRNWQVMPIISPMFKYWIDESTLSSLTTAQKAQFISNVDSAAAEWNSVRIADYLGAIVNLQKMSSNGIGVVPIRYNPSLNDALGQFNPIPGFHKIEIRYYGDYDTILHEFGHMIGLQDLDMNNNSPTHISLMGYAGNGKMHYQDIQGLAVANSKHTEHDYRKYWYDGTLYNYVCFYCDITGSAFNSLSGGTQLENASSCLHTYEKLVSVGNRYWQKCTHCYKVIESEFTLNVKNSNTVEITGLIDNRTSITIPREIGGQNVTHIGNGAFSGNTNVTNVTFQITSYITTIGSSAFKGCTSLKTIEIPNTVTNIDSSAFEDCTSLTKVTLSTSLTSIGSKAFKGCSLLETIDIPNTITHIDSSAFENCYYLQNITLSNHLFAIGSNAFKGCESLNSIDIPSSVEYIDSNAFENCIQLKTVKVYKEVCDITTIGMDAFKNCHTNLTITVPMNRVAEYKNKGYWSSYKNKIVPSSSNYDEINLHCLSDFNITTPLNSGYNKLYKLNVACGKSYKITSPSSVLMNIYDANMTILSSGEGTINEYLSPGTYYMDFRFVSHTDSGNITTYYELRWTSDGWEVSYGSNHNILTHLHKVGNHQYQTQLYYINTKGAGFYEFQLTGEKADGTMITYPAGALQIYNDDGKVVPMDKFSVTGYANPAVTKYNENRMIVYLPRNGYFYLEVHMTFNDLLSLYLDITLVDAQELNLFDLSETTSESVTLVDDTIKGDYFTRLDIKQTGQFTISTTYTGVQTDVLLFVLGKNIYHSSTNTYSLETKRIEFINTHQGLYTTTLTLEEGTYYVGYK